LPVYILNVDVSFMGAELRSISLVIANTLVIYLAVVLLFRILGKRQMSELTISELVVVMILGSSVETSLIGGDTSLVAGLASAATLFLANFLFSIALRRWIWLRRWLVGRPVPLVYNGDLLESRLHRVGLTREDVLQGIRERGYEEIDQVRLAVLEIDGTISVIPRT
jgi:uncharacterized membrane protein YcaP (DUF421 family)